MSIVFIFYRISSNIKRIWKLEYELYKQTLLLSSLYFGGENLRIVCTWSEIFFNPTFEPMPWLVYSIGLTASCQWPIVVEKIIYTKLISVQFEQMLSSIKLTSTLFLCPEDFRWCRIKVDLEYFWPLTSYIRSWPWEAFEKFRRDWSYFLFLLLYLVVIHLKIIF